MAINIDGDGLIALGGTSTTQGRLRLAEDTDNGTNFIELTAPASITSDRTITFPDASGTVDTLNRAGNVLQVVTGTTSAAVTSSTNTLVDVGLSASITPTSASSKILIITNIMGVSKTSTDSGNRVDFKLFRGATELDSSGANLFTSGTTLNLRISWGHSFIDSPATTSSTTYKWQFANAAIGPSVTVQTDANSGKSQITLMEIAA